MNNKGRSFFVRSPRRQQILPSQTTFFCGHASPVISLPQMACCDGSKGTLEEDSYEAPGTFNSNASASLQAYPPQQGYDVEFDPPLESKYECPICLMALRNAIQTPCGHRFCKNCIEKSIR